LVSVKAAVPPVAGVAVFGQKRLHIFAGFVDYPIATRDSTGSFGHGCSGGVNRFPGESVR